MQAALDSVMIGRWQLDITIVYRFIPVPLTIGMSLMVALMQTFWHKTGKGHWLQATRFFGKLLLTTFTLGVATGIAQEFQFGMNWSEYPRYVDDIFGAPLAVEALLAFFLEPTFLGLWIFDWGCLSKILHLVSTWCATIGTMFSTLWILGVNSWMQYPVGATFNAETGQAESDKTTGFLQIVANPALFWKFTHAITSVWLIVDSTIAGLATWQMIRACRPDTEFGREQALNVRRPIARFGFVVALVGGLGATTTGHFQGQEIVELQPMKMVVAEGICMDAKGAAFTIAQFGSCPLEGDTSESTKFVEVPGAAAFISYNDFNAEVQGMADIQKRMVDLPNADPDFTAKYGDAVQYDLRPPQIAPFRSFRLMIVLGMVTFLVGAWGLWAARKGAVSDNKWLGRPALLNMPLPFIAVSFGWIFTEIGRWPWIVMPSLKGLENGDPVGSVMLMTDSAISPNVPTAQILVTLTGLTLLYAILGVIWFVLMRRYTLEGIHSSKGIQEDETVGALSSGY